MTPEQRQDDASCPCGSGQDFADCCGPRLAGDAPAVTAEQLMRSRYTAFARGEADYLLATWHPETRPSRVRLDPAQRWIGLRILHTDAGGENDESGTVEFVARFKTGGSGYRLQELSRFEKIDGRWYYRDGDHR
ncbi:YchJ family protein [Haliea sp. E17]|uniref:YchJ family protein n=1 Tax=Haliea sp. E17 TaxID=3401576 RepID=UPI003AAB47FB